MAGKEFQWIEVKANEKFDVRVIDHQSSLVKVHFKGWSDSHNKWIPKQELLEPIDRFSLARFEKLFSGDIDWLQGIY